MGYTATTTINDYYGTKNEYPCRTPSPVYSSWTIQRAQVRKVLSNDTISRVKPDPLTNTALAKQYTQDVRLSIIPWTYVQRYQDTACVPLLPKRYYLRYIQAKACAESNPIFPSYTLDWSLEVLKHIQDKYVNIGSSLAEYRATGDMFSQFAIGVRDGWQRWRNLKKGRLKLTPCSIPAAELMYSFGIAPLAEDLFSSVEALKLRVDAPIEVDFFKTSTARVVNSVTLSGYQDYTRKIIVSNRVEGTVNLRPTATGVLNIGNPTTWAWELIPFSFVVDWGIPIGDWLGAVDMLKNIISVSGTRTIKEQYQSKYRVRRVDNGVTAIGSWGRLSYNSHERKILSSIPVPPLPRWKPSATWHKVYRAVTLLISVNQPCRKYSRRR